MDASRNKKSAEPVLQAVSACIARHVHAGDSVAVGLSGGLDSSVLLHAVHASAPQTGIAPCAIHVHHGLSPAADAWADFCLQTCAELEVPIAIVRIGVDPRPGEGIEAAARRQRHRAFAAHPAPWMLLAHHADDQAETLLHNLLRGAGLRGAAAIPMHRGKLLRPLLTLSRNCIQAYAKVYGLRWIEDESNADCRFTRNFLRARILPPLVGRFPRGAEHLAAAAGRFGEANALLDDLARLDLAEHAAGFPLPLTLLRELAELRARNVLRALLAWQEVQAPDEPRLNEFVRQLRTAGPDRRPRIDLPGYSLWCERGWLKFGKAA